MSLPADMMAHNRQLIEQFACIATKYPFFNNHQQKVNRTIPVVALVRI